MLKCIDCIHFKACEDWARNFGCYVECSFPYEAEDNLCDYFEPVVHGEWKAGGGIYYCSECGEGALYRYIGSYNPDIYQKLTDYCPNCGAKMDGGK